MHHRLPQPPPRGRCANQHRGRLVGQLAARASRRLLLLAGAPPPGRVRLPHRREIFFVVFLCVINAVFRPPPVPAERAGVALGPCGAARFA